MATTDSCSGCFADGEEEGWFRVSLYSVWLVVQSPDSAVPTADALDFRVSSFSATGWFSLQLLTPEERKKGMNQWEGGGGRKRLGSAVWGLGNWGFWNFYYF
ncbi:unnamed protein product [Linum trigynum]|uniref:Uncharacterized protein n=1 Tax=Linum trigynum TaxID=586398 RepID=A0AAV2ET00_9ROSI